MKVQRRQDARGMAPDRRSNRSDPDGAPATVGWTHAISRLPRVGRARGVERVVPDRSRVAGRDTRSTLVFKDRRVWWDVIAAEPNTRFQFRWPWLADDSYLTVVTVTITPRGYGSLVTLEDGPFDLTRPRVLDAYGSAWKAGARRWPICAPSSTSRSTCAATGNPTQVLLDHRLVASSVALKASLMNCDGAAGSYTSTSDFLARVQAT